MASVDKRIVEMKFNNAAFERGVSKTMASIAKLKSALKFTGASKGLKSVEASAGKVNFSGIERSLDTISKRFTTFGIIGTAALQKLTYSALETGNKIVHAINDPLVEGGKRRALNIEQAKFQFEGLGIDVKKAMASALDAVSGTAFGLDEAAKVASQFGASGMVAGAEMTQSLRAVSGVAAMTGSGYEEIGNIFVQVAGQGRLMGDQLMQLSGRGINAAATLGKALGKSEGDIREMVSDGKISFETFYKAMDEAFGAHAKDANQVFTGSLANMKAALSRIGADVATPAFRSLRNVFNTLTPVIDNVHAALNPLINSMVKTIKASEKLAKSILKGIKVKDLNNIGKGLNNLYKTGGNVFKGLSSMITPFIKGLKEAFPPVTSKNFKEFTKVLKGVTSGFKVTEAAAESFKNVGKGIGNLFASVGNVFKALASYLKPIKEAISETIEPFKETMRAIIPDSLSESFLKLTEGIRSFTEGLKLTDEQSEKVKIIFKTLFTVIGTLLKPVGVLANIVKTVLNPAFKVLGIVFKSVVSSIGSTVKGFITLLSLGVDPLAKGFEVLGPIVSKIMIRFKDFIVHTKVFQTVFGKIKNVVSKVTNVFSKSEPSLSGFANALKVIASMVSKFLISALKKGIEYLPTFINKVKEVITSISGMSKNVGGSIGTILKSALDIFNNFMFKATDFLRKGFTKIVEVTIITINQIIEAFTELPSKIESFGPWFVAVFSAILSTVKVILFGIIKNTGQFVIDVIAEFRDIFKYLSPIILQGFKNVGIAFLNGFTSILKSIGKFITNLPNMFKGFMPWLIKTLTEGIAIAGDSIVESLKYIVVSLDYFVADMGKVAATLAPALLAEFSKGFTIITKAFNDLLGDILEILVDFTKRTSEEAARIGNTIGSTIVKSIENSSSPIARALQQVIVLGGRFSNLFSNKFGDSISKASKYIEAFKDNLSIIGKGFKDAAFERLSPIIDELADKFSFLIEPVKKADQAMQGAFISIEERARIAKNTFSALFDLVKMVFTKIVDFLKPVGDKISDIFEGITIGDIINTVSLMGLIKVFKNLSDVAGGLGKSLSGFLNSASGTLNSVRKALEQYQKSIKADMLKKIAVAVAILAASIVALSFVSPEKVAVGLAAVTAMLGEIIATLKILEKMDIKNTKGINKAAIAMDIIAISIGIMAGALSKLKGFETVGSILPALLAVSTLLGELTAVMIGLIKVIDESDTENMGTELIKVSIAMIAISSAVNKLASACKKLGTMDPGQLRQGAIAIGALLGSLVLFAALNKGKELNNIAATITAISISMLILQKAVEKLGNMDFNVMVTGIRRVAELMGTLVIAMKLMNGVNIKGTASTILALSIALNLLIIPIAALGSMSLTTVAQGLIAVGVALGEMALATKLMGSGSLTGAASIMAMAVALTVLMVPIKVLGSMSLANLATGLGAIAIALGGMTAIMFVLAPLGTSLITVAGAFALFGGAIALVGAGVLAFAVGLTTLAASAGVAVAGLMVFLAAIPMITAEFELAMAAVAAAAPAIGSSFETIGDVIIKTLSHLLQTFVTELVKVVAKFVKEIGKQSPTFVQAGVDIIKAFLKGVQKVIPEVVKTGVTFIKELIKGAKQVIPDIISLGVTIIKNVLKGIKQVSGDVIKTGVDIIKKLLKGIRELFPDIVKTGFDLIKKFLKGVRDNIKDIVKIAADIIVNFIDGISSKLPDIVNSAINLAITFIESIADGIDKNKERFVEAVTKLFNSIIDLIVELITKGLPKMLKKGWELAKKLLEGIKKILPKLPGMALDLVKKLAKGIIDSIPKIADAAADLIGGFVQGIVDGLSAVAKAAKKVASKAVDTVKNFLGIHSPSRVFMQIGEHVINGFAIGITSNKSIKKIVDAGKMMTQSFTTTVKQLIKDLPFGGSAVDAFYNKFVKGTKNVKAGNAALIRMRDALGEFAYQLYLNSDLYKQDTKAAKDRAKEYSKALKEIEKAEKNLEKTRKKAAKSAVKANEAVAKSSKKTAKTVKKSNEETEKSTKKTTKSINDYANAMGGAAKSSDKVLTAKEQFALDQKNGIGKDSKKKKGKKKSSGTSKRSVQAAKNQAKKDAQAVKDAEKALKTAKKNAEKLDKEITKHAETVAKHIKQVYNELRNSLAEGVASFIDPMSMSLDSGIDIFAEFTKEYSLTSSQLLANMKSQNEGVRKWNADLATLIERGLDEGLVQKLRDAGPQSAEQVHAFMQMSVDELKEANAEWKKANELTAETVLKNQKDALKAAQEWADGITELAKRGLNKDLLKSLGDAGVGSAEYVKAYLAMTPKQLKDLNKSYKETMKLPKKIADEVIASYIAAGDKSLSGFVEGVTGNTTKGKKNKKKIKKEVHKLMQLDTKDANKKAEKDGEDFTESLTQGIKKGVERTREVSKSIGGKLLEGLSEGISEEERTLQETLDKLKETVTEGIKSYLKPLSMGLDSGIDIFKEFSREYEVTSSEIIANMKSQNEGVRQWNEDLATLVARGLDEGFVQKLKEMGPQSAEYVYAFLNATTEQLKQANEEWKQANELTAETVLQNQKDAVKAAQEWADGIRELAKRGLNKELLKELGEAGVGSAEYVKAYLSMTPSQLAELNASYEENMKIPEDIAKSIAESYAEVGSDSLEGFVDGVSGNTPGGSKTLEKAKDNVQNFVKATTKVDTSEAKENGSRVVRSVTSGINEAAKSLIKHTTKLGEGVTYSIEQALNEETGKEIGSSMVDGVAEGITSQQKAINRAVENLKSTVSSSIKSFIAPLSQSLNTGIDIFTEFTTEYELTSQQLLDNMASQNLNVRKWQYELEVLVRKGLDKGLVQQLKDAGPKSAEQVHALMEMSIEELRKANDQWLIANAFTAQTVIQNQKDALQAAQEWAEGIEELARRGLNKDLLKELGDAGVGSSEYVKAYLSMTPKQIEEMNELYSQYLTIPDTIAEAVVGTYASTGEDAAEGFTEAVVPTEEMTNTIAEAWGTSIEEAGAQVAEKGREVGTAVANGMTEGFVAASGISMNVGDAMEKEIENASERAQIAASYAKEVGTNFAGFLALGVKNNTAQMVEETTKATNEAIATVDQTSKKGMENAGIKAAESFTGGVTSIGDSNSSERKEIEETYVDTTEYVGAATAKEAKVQGEETVKALAKGALQKEVVVRNAFIQIGKAAFDSLRAFLNYDIGIGLANHIVEGIVIGFQNNESKIQEEAKAVALKALSAAKSALGIASPSKEFIKVGEYSTEGMAIGIKNREGDILDAGDSVSNKLLEIMRTSSRKINAILSSDISEGPVITPVVDLSNVMKASKSIDAALTKDLATKLAADTHISLAKRSISDNDKTSTSKNDDSSGPVTNNYSLTQNNYSPKSLSRADIYRDTKSLFAQFKRGTESA